MAIPISPTVVTKRDHDFFRYTQNVYFEDGLGLTALLSALLFLVVAASFDAAGYAVELQLLLPITGGALAMSLLMAYSRFDSFFAFSHGMLTGLAWILYLMASTVPEEERALFIQHGFSSLQAGVNSVLLHLLQWTQLVSAPDRTADSPILIFGLSFLLWWLTYLGVWSIFRYGYTWRAVMPAGVLLLISSFYAPQPLIVYLVLFAFLALLLFARTNLAEQQLRWRFQHAYVSQTIAPDVMRTGLSYVVLVLLCAWLAPGLGRSSTIKELLPDAGEVWTKVQTTIERGIGPIPQIGPDPVPTFGPSMQLGGERRVGDELIFKVYTEEGRYWRAIVFDRFDGRGWQNTTELQLDFETQSMLPVAEWQQREPMTQTFVLHEATNNVILGAPDILWIDQPISAKVVPLTAVPLRMRPDSGQSGSGQPQSVVPVEFTFAQANGALTPGTIYTVVSNRSVVTEEALRGAKSSYPVAITEHYLQLPDNFSPDVAQLARILVAGVPATAYDQAKAIEAHLRTIPYNDAIPAPPADVDPLIYFLFVQQEGYCDYYATAMATMLRSLGIPARIASGYAEGTKEPETNYYTVYARDAHTWVEVYFPDYGWIEFEPTAGENSLQRDATANVLPPALPTPTVAGPTTPLTTPLTTTVTPTTTLTLEPHEPVTPGDGESTGIVPGTAQQQPWWLWALLTPPLLLLTFWGLRHTPVFGPTTFTVDQPLILYTRLLHWTERLGINLPVTDTPYEWGWRLGRRLPEGRASIQQIVHAYVLYRFRHPSTVHATADAAGHANLQQAWHSLESMLRKAWLRRVYRSTLRRNG